MSLTAPGTDGSNPGGIFVQFNQDCTSLVAGSPSGYHLFALTQDEGVEEIYASNSGQETCLVDRLFSSSLVAIVTVAAPRKLIVCHYKKGTEICNYSYSNTILAVKLNRSRLVVCLEESLHIHNIRDMKILHTIRDTPPNPRGLCALAPAAGRCLLAYPGCSAAGEVQVFDAAHLTAACALSAHESALAALAWSACGRRLATASERGTVIRVFAVPERARLFELRRGVKRCVSISCLAFSACGALLAAASNTETVHVFRLHDAHAPDDRPPGGGRRLAGLAVVGRGGGRGAAAGARGRRAGAGPRLRRRAPAAARAAAAGGLQQRGARHAAAGGDARRAAAGVRAGRGRGRRLRAAAHAPPAAAARARAARARRGGGQQLRRRPARPRPRADDRYSHRPPRHRRPAPPPPASPSLPTRSARASWTPRSRAPRRAAPSTCATRATSRPCAPRRPRRTSARRPRPPPPAARRPARPRPPGGRSARRRRFYLVSNFCVDYPWSSRGSRSLGPARGVQIMIETRPGAVYRPEFLTRCELTRSTTLYFSTLRTFPVESCSVDLYSTRYRYFIPNFK